MSGSEISVQNGWLERLDKLAIQEREYAIKQLVVDLLRKKLLMQESDDLPTDQSYFELGLTSLASVELQEELEMVIANKINSASLFNNPTVDQLVAHIREEALQTYFEDKQSNTAVSKADKEIIREKHSARDLLSDMLGGN